MTRFLTTKRLGILFVGLFGIALVGMFAYQKFYIDPEQRCIKSGRWWYQGDCVQPIYLPDITGRPAGVSRAQASDEKNRELISLEHSIAAQRAAQQAATNRDRAAVEGKAP